MKEIGHTITLVNQAQEECVCNNSNNFHGIISNIPSEYRDKISNIIYGVPIPEGFRYVKGTKDTGLVVTDSFTGEEDQGNEFVWIPVDDINNFTRTAFCRENLTSATTGTARFNKFWIDESTTEFTNLRSSVAKYKGFYFGRFETSKIPNIDSNIAQIKRNYAPWTSIKDSAYTKSSGMYDSNNGYYNYISTHLVYPHEWDAMINWLISSGAKTSSELTQNSSSWGNYKVLSGLTNISTLQNTGSNEATVANNIYDIAGNASEITQELNGIDSRISIRGGSYKDYGNNDPAASRADIGSSQTYLGFRICMCINV